MKHPQPQREGEEGYLLLGLVVACFILLLFLGIAAPRAAKELERDRELEAEHRAQEYVRAIQLYYRKNNSYPNSIEQLAGSSGMGGVTTSALNVRYLRQQYKDPLTGDDFRLIHVGENKTQVKSFFGEPLEGMPQGGQIAGTSIPGTSAGASTSIFGNNGTASGSTGSSSFGSSAFNNSGTGSSTSPTGTSSSFGSSTTGSSGSTGSTGSSMGGTDATSFGGSKGPIMGVGSNAKGHGLVEWNSSENIQDWEFLYDPRVELLKSKVSIFGGAPAATGNGSMGSGLQTPGNSTGLGSTSIFGPSGTGTGTSGASGSTGSTGSTGNTSTFGTNPTQ